MRVITDFGAEGVSVFFMLSGFLAASKKVSGIKEGLKYYLNRAIRILPLYYVVVSYYFFVLRDVILFEEDVYGVGWKRYFLLANCVIPGGGGKWDNLGALWSIFVIIGFYFTVPFWSKFVNSIKSAAIFELITIGITLYWSNHLTGYLGWIKWMPYFGIGILVYYGVKEEKNDYLYALFSLGAIFNILQGGYYKFTYLLLIAIVFTCGLSLENREKKLYVKFNEQWLFKADRYSYTVYLVHAAIIETMSAIAPIGEYTFFMKGIFLIVMTIVFTLIVYHFYERPVYAILNKVYAKINR